MNLKVIKMKSKIDKKKVRRRSYSYDATFENDEIVHVHIEGDENNIVSVIIYTKNYRKGFEVGTCDECNAIKKITMSSYNTVTKDEKKYCEKCTDKMCEEKYMVKEREREM